MSEKPQKRLVSWKLYMQTMGAKGVAYSLGILCACGVLYLLRQSLFNFWHGLRDGDGGAVGFSILSLTGVIYAVACMKMLFKDARKIEPVSLLTAQNAHMVPPKDSLVRASDAPPSHQQAELLRAAQYGKETSPDELLRAVQENRQD